MTSRDTTIGAWFFLAFGWAFDLAGINSGNSDFFAVGIVLFSVALFLFLKIIFQDFGDGGPWSAA